MNLATRLVMAISAVGSDSYGVSTPTDRVDESKVYSWPTGTGADEANQCYHAESTIATSATTTFDFAGGGLVNAFGESVAPARVKAIYIENTGTVAITVGGTNGIVGSGFTLRPGEAVLKAAPDATAYAVSGGSTDTVTLTNTSGATEASYSIIVIGAQ